MDFIAACQLKSRPWIQPKGSCSSLTFLSDGCYPERAHTIAYEWACNIPRMKAQKIYKMESKLGTTIYSEQQILQTHARGLL